MEWRHSESVHERFFYRFLVLNKCTATKLLSSGGGMAVTKLMDWKSVESAYQTADIPTSPNGAVELWPNGTFEDSEGVQFPSGWKPLDAGVQTKQSIRFGWLVKNSSGTALSSARVGGQIQIVTC